VKAAAQHSSSELSSAFRLALHLQRQPKRSLSFARKALALGRAQASLALHSLKSLFDLLQHHKQRHQRLSLTTSETISEGIRDHLRPHQRPSTTGTSMLNDFLNTRSALPLLQSEATKRITRELLKNYL